MDAESTQKKRLYREGSLLTIMAIGVCVGLYCAVVCFVDNCTTQLSHADKAILEKLEPANVVYILCRRGVRQLSFSSPERLTRDMILAIGRLSYLEKINLSFTKVDRELLELVAGVPGLYSIDVFNTGLAQTDIGEMRIRFPRIYFTY